MKCNFCGKRHKKTEVTCPHCGKEVHTEGLNNSQIMDNMPELHDELSAIGQMRKRRERRMRAGIITTAVIVLCVGLGVGAMLFVKNMQGKEIPVDAPAVVPESVAAEPVTKILEEGFCDVLVTDADSALAAVNSARTAFGIVDTDVDFVYEKEISFGTDTYYRFSQSYRGIKVYGGEMILLADANGTAAVLNGTYIPADGLDTDAKLNSANANNAISTYINKLSEDFCVKDGIRVTEAEPIVCNYKGKSYFAYMAEVSGYNEKGEFVGYDAFVDADLGNGLFTFSKAGYVNGEQETADSAVDAAPQEAEPIDSLTGIYSMYTVSHKFDWNAENRSSALDELPEEAVFSGEASKLVKDIKHAVDGAYNYFSESFGWRGLDGVGSSFRVYLNSNEYVAESLSEDKALYYDDVLMFVQENTTETEFQPNIATHEYAHGVFAHVADLAGTASNTENAAIGEGMADVFAELCEGDSADWMVGGRNIAQPTGVYLAVLPEEVRVLSAANAYHYGTIVSHMAYTMHQEGIGAKKLGELYFRTLCLLNKNNGFAEFASLLELSAKKMMAEGTLSDVQFTIVKDALRNVNLKESLPENTQTEAMIGEDAEETAPEENTEFSEDAVIE